MLFGNKAEQYPHLIAYLRETERLDFFREFNQRWSVIMSVAVLAPFCIGVLTGVQFFGVVLVTAACAGMANYIRRQKKAELFTPELESRLEAQRLFGSMRRMLALNRLHRDLSEATLSLLNEISRSRIEIKQLLENAYWKQPTLPSTYAQLRDQASAACDQAMYDAVMQFKMIIPTEIESRRPGDYVNEALETILKSPKQAYPGGEIGFDAAFRIADKLQQLRNEIDAMTSRGESENIVSPTDIPGGLLDLTMSEIRTIRQAEDELRQGL